MTTKRSAASRFNAQGCLYAFTTENLGGYMERVVKRQGAVLCVAGSGDHLLNALFCGASRAAAFDLNPRALWWCELKLSAVHRLSLREYLDFFLRHDSGGAPNPRALDRSVFDRLACGLSGPARDFFEECYRGSGGRGSCLRQSKIFNNRHDNNELKIGCNPYLQSEDAFLSLKEELSRGGVVLYSGSASDMVQRTGGETFDLILLSNIADYTHELYPDFSSPLQRFTDEVLRPLAGLLCPDGILCAAYLYSVDDQPQGAALHSQIDDAFLRQRLFSQAGFQYEELSFPSVMPGKKDAVILLNMRRGVL
jgi:hypothetical protein